MSNLYEAVLRRRVAVLGVQTVCQEAIIRHTGWIGSLIIAVFVTVVSDALGAPKSAAAWIVALEAVCSDLIFPKVRILNTGTHPLPPVTCSSDNQANQQMLINDSGVV